MRGMHSTGRRLILLACLFTTTCAHSWVEQLMVIASNGTFIGAPGYPRGNVLRTDSGFSDNSMTYLIPPIDRPNPTLILPSDKLCKDTQRKQVQSKGSPRLQASAGAAIALRFQENGHVTLPETQIGKPDNRGTIYIYGTTDPREDEKLLDVHKVWNKDGTGGDRRGVLLAKRNYDDGRCYQVNDGKISVSRQAEFPHDTDQLMGADLWCQADIAIPSNAPSGKPYTLYWVWDWPTAPKTDPGLPDGKQEVYTTCMDVDVVDGPEGRSRIVAGYIHDQSLNSASIPEQFAEIFGRGSEESATITSKIPTATSREPVMVTSFVTSYVTSVQIVYPTGYS